MGRKKKEENDEEIKKPKAIGPFDIIKMMFTDKESFDKLSNLILSKNFFMINRIFAIKFPLQAQCFNMMGVDQANVIRSWQQFGVRQCGYGKVPSFVFTKTAKSKETASVDELSKDLKNAYCNHYRISMKDLNDMLYFYHDSTVEHVKEFEEIVNAKDIIEKLK